MEPTSAEDSTQRPLTPGDAPIRNPSPPPDDLLSGEDRSLLNADTIGNTVFSKHWVFSILMKLIQQVEKEETSQQEDVDPSEEHDGIDIDEELESELCRLWDMTANMEVARFLQEWKSPDIFLSVISKTNAPRITEICMGVLGNMACSPAIRREFSKNQELIDLSFSLLSGSDAPTMVETSRLIYTCLNDDDSALQWLETVKKDDDVMRSITFILQSSMNNDLIHNVADLLDQLLDLDDDLLQTWSGPILIQTITEALNQISADQANTLSLLHHSLQVISTTNSGIDGLVELSDKVYPLLSSFVSGVFDDGVLSMRGRENTLASVISVLSVLLRRSREVSKHLAENESRTISQLAEILYVIHRREASSSSSSSSSNDGLARLQVQTRNGHTDGPSNVKPQGSSIEEEGSSNGLEGEESNVKGSEDGKTQERIEEEEEEKDEEEEDPEKVWLTELLKNQLIGFFTSAVEVAKEVPPLQHRLQSCGTKRLQVLVDCLEGSAEIFEFQERLLQGRE